MSERLRDSEQVASMVNISVMSKWRMTVYMTLSLSRQVQLDCQQLNLPGAGLAMAGGQSGAWHASCLKLCLEAQTLGGNRGALEPADAHRPMSAARNFYTGTL